MIILCSEVENYLNEVENYNAIIYNKNTGW